MGNLKIWSCEEGEYQNLTILERDGRLYPDDESRMFLRNVTAWRYTPEDHNPKFNLIHIIVTEKLT